MYTVNVPTFLVYIFLIYNIILHSYNFETLKSYLTLKPFSPGLVMPLLLTGMAKEFIAICIYSFLHARIYLQKHVVTSTDKTTATT